MHVRREVEGKLLQTPAANFFGQLRVVNGAVENVAVGERDEKRRQLGQKYYIDSSSITAVKIPYELTTGTVTETATKVVTINRLSQDADDLGKVCAIQDW